MILKEILLPLEEEKVEGNWMHDKEAFFFFTLYFFVQALNKRWRDRDRQTDRCEVELEKACAQASSFYFTFTYFLFHALYLDEFPTYIIFFLSKELLWFLTILII